MAIGQHKRAVGVFSHYRDAEVALNELRASGFPMHKVSVVAQNRDGRNNVGGVGMSDRPGKEAGEGAKAGAVAGAATGGLIGLIGSLTALTIPGIGPIVAGGALASILADTLVGGAIGAAAGGLIGALVGLGVPEDRARIYNERVNNGDYLIVVEGTDEQIHAAQAILSSGGIQDWGVYDAPVGGTTTKRTDRHQRAVGIFSSRAEAERALHDLRDAGFPMNKVSVIARDADRNDDIAGVDVKDRVGNKADEGATAGALTGGALGGITGLLVGLGALAIPGIGPIMLAGAEATAIASTLAGTAIGATAGSLIGALVGLGIPEDRAKVYGDRVAKGDYLVMVNGSEDEVRHADVILNHRGIQEWGVYDAPTPNRTDASYATTGAPGVPFPETVYDADAENLGRR